MASGESVVARNRKARFNYEIHETYEAGIELKGSEVKSLRDGKVNIEDAFARVHDGEVYLYNLHISPYDKAGVFNHDPRRVRKLLLHKREIRKLAQAVEQRGRTIVPLSLYFKNGWAKLKIGVASGKRKVDRREDMKKREAEREIRRAMQRRR